MTGDYMLHQKSLENISIYIDTRLQEHENNYF